ncbi:sulfite exporter TauE/SafE family protein [Aliidiomarina iranensis]|uniref:Probable membrane transporter protein n=1 Tax=Aliidiomarina iranensis TaxID=1434071 RepID=A0A432W219_9GAMM|nr:sulfite exporter TauE/SafE family protein [Aliidiomarina iranensis]RUO23280.1 sulfite exporter TauE/SafE family protein [Aliidiomarina iranensis]
MVNAVLGAILIGLSLGIFGSGGSILTVPVLMYLVHMPADMAIASSLIIVAGISLFGAGLHIRKKLISWPHVWLFGIPGMLGTYGGAWAGTVVDPRWQLLLFVALMLVASVFMWRNSQSAIAAEASALPKKLNIPKVAADGLVVGAITGFVGVGGGFLIVPALVLMGGLALPLAIGTSLLIITLKSVIGFLKYYEVLHAAEQQFNWPVISLLIAGGILGSGVGVYIGTRLPKQKLQKGFAVFLVIMGIFVLMRSVL